MSVCLTRLALLTRYDKLPSMLTPSLGYLWLINWTEKGPCRPSRGTLQCSSSGPSSKRRTKEGIGGGSTLKCLLLGWRHSSPKISRCVKKQNKTLGSTGEPVWGWWAVHLPPSLCCCLVPSREACAQALCVITTDALGLPWKSARHDGDHQKTQTQPTQP